MCLKTVKSLCDHNVLNFATIFSVRFALRELEMATLKYSWHSFTIFTLMVLNNLIKNLFVTRSSDRRCDFVKGHTAKLYNNYVIIFTDRPR